jgi:hypothetical protein
MQPARSTGAAREFIVWRVNQIDIYELPVFPVILCALCG